MPVIPAEVYLACLAASSTYSMSLSLLLAIAFVESSFNPLALGDYNAQGQPQAFGLFQLHIFGAGAGYSSKELLDPYTNAAIAAQYLAWLRDIFEDEEEALAAYNAGPAKVKAHGWQVAKGYVEKVREAQRELSVFLEPLERLAAKRELIE